MPFAGREEEEEPVKKTNPGRLETEIQGVNVIKVKRMEQLHPEVSNNDS